MDYNDLVSSLKASQVQEYQPDPVLTEKVNDAAAFGKSVLSGVGGMLEGEAIKKTFKSLSKKGSEGLLKQLNLNEEEMNELADKVATGDVEGISKFVGERGISLARNKIGAFVRNTGERARGAFKNFIKRGRGEEETPADTGEPASAAEVAAEPEITTPGAAAPASEDIDAIENMGDVRAVNGALRSRFSNLTQEAQQRVESNYAADEGVVRTGEGELENGLRSVDDFKINLGTMQENIEAEERAGNIARAAEASTEDAPVEAALGGDAPLIPQADGGFRIGQPESAYGQPESASPATELTDQAEMTNDAMRTSGPAQTVADAEASTDTSLGTGVAEETGEEVASVGSKVAKGLDAITADSAAFDETPIGIGVTALLGLGSLIGGIFIKTHKDKFTRPPIPRQMQSSFAVQKGFF